MKNYLKNNLNNDEYQFPYLGFIMDEHGSEHDFGFILEGKRDTEKTDNYRHFSSLLQKVKELYPKISLRSAETWNLCDLVGELTEYNLITYLNLSGEEKVLDGALQVGQSPTLKQRAALREYNNFFIQHILFPIHHFYDEKNYDTYHMDIDEFLDLLYENEHTKKYYF